jgi:hypothetical protein
MTLGKLHSGSNIFPLIIAVKAKGKAIPFRPGQALRVPGG